MAASRGALACVLAAVAVTLHGCGGGGGGGGGNSPSPPGPAPPLPMNYYQMSVVTYNLYWWCVSGVTNHGGQWCPKYAGGKGWNLLYAKMKQFGPYDLIGLQECENAQQIGTGIGYGTSHEWKQGPADIGMGWNRSKFEKLGDYNSTIIGKDQWGDRYLAWVRLKFKDSDATVFFANTHGPLPGPYGNCDQHTAENYVKVVSDNRKPGDAVVVTGDFNCIGVGHEIAYLNDKWTLAANDRTTHFDHIYILNTTTRVDSWGDHNGAPSDHSILFSKVSAGVPKIDDASELVV